MPDRIVLFDHHQVLSAAASKVLDLGELDNLVVEIDPILVDNSQGTSALRVTLQHSNDALTWYDLVTLEYSEGAVREVKSYTSGVLRKFRVLLDIGEDTFGHSPCTYAIISVTVLLRRPATFSSSVLAPYQQGSLPPALLPTTLTPPLVLPPSPLGSAAVVSVSLPLALHDTNVTSAGIERPSPPVP